MVVESDTALIAALRNGDEAAFTALIERHHTSMLRVAQTFVPSRAVAEEVVQETWLGVLKGLAGFEGRSSLRTWIFRILVNIAKTRGTREARSVPFSSIGEAAEDEPSVDSGRFHPTGHPGANGWAHPPKTWEHEPEERVLSKEVRALIDEAIDALSPAQRAVIVLRDVEGWTSDEVCNALGVTETNHRVLLHRARSKVRQALEIYFGEERDE